MTPEILNTALVSIGIFNTLVAIWLIYKSTTGTSLPKRLLTITLSIQGFAVFILFMVNTRYILHVPWLYRIPSPLYYLVYPITFLYIRKSVRNEARFFKKDLLHFLPAFLNLLELLPYYFSSAEFKMETVNNLFIGGTVSDITNTEGWFPVNVHNILRGVQGLIYGALNILFLYRYAKKKNQQLSKEVFQWLWAYNIITMITPIVVTFLLSQMNLASGYRNSGMLFVVSANQVLCCLMIFYYPQISNGLSKWNENTSLLDTITQKLQLLPAELSTIECKQQNEMNLYQLNKVLPGSLPAENETKPPRRQHHPLHLQIVHSHELISKMEKLMAKEKPFLKQQFAASDLAKDLGIPYHHLSYIMNQLMKVRFNQYINLRRIAYMEERLRTEDLGYLTLEAFAMEAGFSSRITFIKVVQKITGKNPSVFFNIRGRNHTHNSISLTNDIERTAQIIPFDQNEGKLRKI